LIAGTDDFWVAATSTLSKIETKSLENDHRGMCGGEQGDRR
jgi:hypothetical protein